MAMTKGTVSIDDEDGSVSGGGMARDIFNALIDGVLGDMPEDYSLAMEISAKKAAAKLCNAFADGIVTHIKDHARADDTDAGEEWDIL